MANTTHIISSLLRLTAALIGCLCTLSAAAQQLYLPLEVRQPAALRIAGDIQRVLVVDGTNQKDLGRMCVFTTAQTLEDLARFDEVGVMEKVTDSLCERYDVDALMVLNGLLITDAAGAEPLENGMWEAWLEVQCMARWTIAYCSGASRAFVTADTLVWEAKGNTQSAAINELPENADAQLEMAAYEGEQMARRITPQWVTEERYLYKNDNAHLLAGMEAFRRKDWNGAFAHWSEACEADKETAAYAAADIALAFEMQDRYDEAIAWTKRAVNAFRKLRTADAAQQVVNLTYYQSQLQKRKTYVF